jgi:hypothetical protein
VTVGHPDERSRVYGLILLLRDLVGHLPRSKVEIASEPRIGNQHRVTVVSNEGCISNSVKTQIHQPRLPVGRESGGQPEVAIKRKPHTDRAVSQVSRGMNA